MFLFIKQKIKNVILALAIIYIPIWIMFVFNNGLLGSGLINFFGINPRVFDLSEIFGIMGSWLLHGDSNHLMGNSIGLFGLVLFIGLFEKRYINLFLMLILSSGVATWLLGASNSVIIGASGLLFALFGYVIGSALFGKKPIYFIPIIISIGYYGFSYYSGFLDGLLLKDGVAWSAHFGGLASGLLIAYVNKNEDEVSFSFKLKRKIQELKFKISNKF